MRNVAVVTTSRADFGIYQPVLQKIAARNDLRLELVVSGSHLDERHGMTVDEVIASGHEIAARIPILEDSDHPVDIATAIASGVGGIGGFYSEARPDLVLILGDRYEMLSAAIAAIPFKIPVAHIHGGEITEGAFDDSIRHAITKLSHLHFTSTDSYAARVRQMGEENWRIVVSGAPSLDHFKNFIPASDEELHKAIGLSLPDRPLLLTYHPTTLGELSPREEIENLLSALSDIEQPLVFTAPNADPGSREISDRIETFVKMRRNAVLVTSLGSRFYFSMMSKAATLIGNSSSGIIEAASFRLPVLDIGNRQAGRLRPQNVINVVNHVKDIRDGLIRVLDPKFRNGLHDMQNPYYKGGASDLIAERLATVALDARLIVKKFVDADDSVDKN
jgi:UDP-hydrolysing UDP-N-acetyl-D-glucosamine 2-epimerase